MLCLSGLELYSCWLAPNIVGNETNNHFRPCFGLRRLRTRCVHFPRLSFSVASFSYDFAWIFWQFACLSHTVSHFSRFACFFRFVSDPGFVLLFRV